MTNLPLISLDSIETIGSGLTRPESVYWHNDLLFSSDAKGAIAITDGGGSTRFLAAPGALPEGVRPNGIARRSDGTFVFANLGFEGGVWEVTADGLVRPLVMQIDGVPLPSTNFVYVDAKDRVWICVSSTDPNCHDPDFHFKRSAATGFVAVVDSDGGSRIVADRLGWTNECRIDATGTSFYVNETIGRRLTTFTISENGELVGRETVTEFGAGTWPDGLALDRKGNIWITSPISNRVLQIRPQGGVRLIVEDAHPDSLAEAEAAFQKDDFRRSHFYNAKSRRLHHVTSIAFSANNNWAFLGSLRSESLYRFPIAGLIA
ncbi:SMP-30/gluconolactonase/LRE family protein [Paraburkholderia sp. Tr-20389]|uniref:SMP-30/gluconolactonase/LRE family protein n=1 Tax=Paraburkholderia sp. Tr-20389 TaxID=2703903 RepID=UPI0019806C6C|nr:SMP-30/gluconolactonase/LRE family protein [Paraburkholderia sp. Tr-20389]MBN3754356.1 SMP-30/gluconolactonase/LRE family protein [Paraburkholderia sp. Tr-20389]